MRHLVETTQENQIMNRQSILDEYIADSVPGRGIDPSRPINYSGVVASVDRVPSRYPDASDLDMSTQITFDDGRTYLLQVAQREQLKNVMPR